MNPNDTHCTRIIKKYYKNEKNLEKKKSNVLGIKKKMS